MFTSFKRGIIDIETNGLLNELIDFSSMPLRLKSTARLWCIVITNADDLSQSIVLRQEECTRQALKNHLQNTEEIVYHNGVKYDAVVLQLFGILDYTIYYDLVEDYNGTLFNKPVKVTDTLILSKLLNPDRFFGHSLKAWGLQLKDYKDDYRQVCIDAGYISKDSPKGEEFRQYYEEVVPYCITDTTVTGAVLQELTKEAGSFQIQKAYHMELKLADLTLRQELYGFKFNVPLGNFALNQLNGYLETIANKVDPLLPPKILNKGDQKDFKPPSRQYKANGDISAFLQKFIHKIGATLSEDKSFITFEGLDYPLPLDPDVCLKTSMPSTIDDLDNLKAHLLDLGWVPIEWKERDLTKDSKKKKLDRVKFLAAVDRYVNNTLEGVYKKHRLEILGVLEEDLREYLLGKEGDFAIRVPVSPSIRIGTDKKLCPRLELLGAKANFVEDVVQYLTYKHRRNSIAGGTVDEEGEPLTGYLSLVREDGRISTPADTNGAGTTRYRHIGVANIPRVSSLYGSVMRGLFGPGDDRVQFGFDYASLEARVQGHFVIPYSSGQELADSLVAEKPNDCFDMLTQILTPDGWLSSDKITEDTLVAEWSSTCLGIISFVKPTNIIRRKHNGKMVVVKGDRLDIRVTPNHRVIVYNRDIAKYVTMEAIDLRDYVASNPNSFIPANGYLSTHSELPVKFTNTIIDGSEEKPSCFVFKSLDKTTIDNIATNQRLSGSSSLILEKNTKKGEHYYQTAVGKTPLNKDGFKLVLGEISLVDSEEEVWCVSVPSSYVLVKRNNSIYVSGNCHTLNSIRLGITRDDAKAFNYASMYGAQASKLAKMLRVPEKEGKRLFELYWEGVPALKELKEKVEHFWESTNKQYILSIDKRKLLVRSKHSLVNLLFQSTGSLLMKYSAVEICKRLDELGLLGDPLLHKEDSEKVFMMIVYHKFIVVL